MNIVNIARKEILSSFRDKKTLIFMLAFPIVLIVILGTALTNEFNHQVSIDDIHVLYKDQSDGELSQGFKVFAKEAKKSGVHFKKVLSDMDGRKEVEKGRYDGYIKIESSGIKLYKSDQNSIEGSIIQGMLSAFTDKYKTVAEIYKVNPKQAGAVLANSIHDDYIKDTSLHSAKRPSAIDYYSITMTTLIALYAALHASYLIRGERLRNTADRLVAAPVQKWEIFTGKLIGGIVTNALCIFLVVAVSKFLFKANWGDHIGLVLFVLFTVVLFAVSLGVGVSYLTKTGEAAKTIINVLIPLVAFFGGAYFPLDDTEGILSMITKLSPIKWSNEAMMKVIYANDLAAALPAAALNIGLSVFMLLIAVAGLRRREGL
ncbi:ABC transporter permease [Bacillus glycinifermentans]|uniref:ABC transporter permease n=1 Tax=Bacillus glycinifermentans TaxID=1664069 RepID=A0A0T6BKA5_9BACI|nr:ABC transporter permease [Bacillus glycinifermentans]ATH93628.1 ABC transporter permease [Bacillus glycinifermentans]KRT90198.1 ABC transporter permease [Bacillus glycinifermentans]MEC0483885.1 ABC transporter permease [Bacillus glycinifermentans]